MTACGRALLALAAPKHRASQGPLGERRPSAERLGQAFAELIENYPTDKLPKSGGLNATVVVLMQYETLLGSLYKQHGGAMRRIALSRLERVGGMHGWRAAMPVTQWMVTKP